MSSQIVAAVVGGIIGAVSSLAASILLTVLGNLRRSKSIRAIAIAEITAIEEKARRFVEGLSTADELRASTPLLTSIASELGYLSPKEVIAFRRIVTLDMEMRQSQKREKAISTIDACQEAKRIFPTKL